MKTKGEGGQSQRQETQGQGGKYLKQNDEDMSESVKTFLKEQGETGHIIGVYGKSK